MGLRVRHGFGRSRRRAFPAIIVCVVVMLPAISGCAVVSIVSAAATVTVGVASTVADVGIGAVKITGKGIGKGVDAVTGSGSSPTAEPPGSVKSVPN